VLKDNTFSLMGQRFEAPRDLRSRKVGVRFDRNKWKTAGTARVIVFYKGDRMGEAREVNFLSNDRKPSRNREQLKP
jgi:hypothetical protein